MDLHRPKPFVLTALALLQPVVLALVLAGIGLPAHGGQKEAELLYQDAMKRLDNKDLPGAALQLKNAIQQDRTMLAAHLMLGRVLLNAGELKGAEAALQEALRQGVGKAEVFPLLGQVYLREGEPARLLEEIQVTGLPPSYHAEILTLRGTALAMTGNLTGASAAFELARSADPKSAAPLVAEAPILQRYGQVDRARDLAAKAVQLEPRNAQAWHQLGNLQQASGQRKEALESQDKALALQPKLMDAIVAKASVLASLDRPADALKLLDQLKADKAAEPRAAFLRALLQSASGNEAEAKASYTEAVNLIDTMPPALRATSEHLLTAGALSHRALGNLAKAREYLDTLLVRNPRHFAGLMLQGAVLLEAREYAKAQPLIENLLRQAPNDPQVLYMMGSVYLARKQYAQASEFFERATALGRGQDSLRELAFSQFGLRNEKLALTNLEKVFAQNPGDQRAGIELAIYHARHGQPARANQIAESLAKRQPQDPLLQTFLGNIRGRTGDNKGMRQAFERSLSLSPGFRPAVLNLARLDLEEGKLDAARTRLANWLKDNAKDGEVLFFAGQVEWRAGRPQQALELWARAREVNRADPRAGLATVDALLATNRVDDALAAARRLNSDVPQSVPVQQTLARAYMAAGDNNLARQTLRESVRMAGFDAPLLVTTGRMLLSAGDLDGAAHASQKALAVDATDLDAMLFRVELAGRRRDAAAVDAALKDLLARHPGKVPVLVTAGHVALSRQQPAQAVGWYQKAYELEPTTPIALLLARGHTAVGQTDKALAVLVAAHRRSPEDPIAWRAVAETQAATGQFQEALKNYEGLAARYPDDAGIAGGFADVLATRKDPRGLAMAEKAARLAPQDVRHASRYGWMLAQTGDVDGGLRILRDARFRDPGNGALRWQLALLLNQAGRKSEAREELRAALSSANPPNPGPPLDRLKADLGL